MTLKQAKDLYPEAEKFLSGGYNPPADSPLRAMTKTMMGGSFAHHITMTSLGICRLIAADSIQCEAQLVKEIRDAAIRCKIENCEQISEVNGAIGAIRRISYKVQDELNEK